MLYHGLFKIDIFTHHRLHQFEKSELETVYNYRLYLQRAKMELLNKAVIEGVFDDYGKRKKISFMKLLYDREEKEKAIYYLTSQYIFEHPEDSFWKAQNKAEELYQKYNPYNLVMVIEEEITDNEI